MPKIRCQGTCAGVPCAVYVRSAKGNDPWVVDKNSPDVWVKSKKEYTCSCTDPNK